MRNLININKAFMLNAVLGQKCLIFWEAVCAKTVLLWLHQLTSIEQGIQGTTQQTVRLYRNLPRLHVYLQIFNHPRLKKKKKFLTGEVKQNIDGSNVARRGWLLENSTSGKCPFFWAIMQCMPVLAFSTNWSDRLTKPFCLTSESNQTDPSPGWLVSLQVLISKQTNL